MVALVWRLWAEANIGVRAGDIVHEVFPIPLQEL